MHTHTNNTTHSQQIKVPKKSNVMFYPYSWLKTARTLIISEI